jgi:[ribosomal protein S18]-alanine N-acetyltransferase
LVVIRPARANEAAIVADIGFRAWEGKLSVWSDDAAHAAAIRPNARHAYETFARDGWPTILVAEIDGAIAGWGAREHDDHQISDLWVAPEFQGQGIGSTLIAALESVIAAHRHATAVLETHARNHEAIAFFQARGYSVKWLSTSYAPGIDRDIEKVGMEKQLSDTASQGE